MGSEMTDPEPCTTQSARKLHYSRQLVEAATYRDVRPPPPGRSGQTLCGQSGRDEVRINHERSWWRAHPVAVADLPPCKACTRAAGIPVAAAPYRIDVPTVPPPHVTSLREERTGRLWVWVPDEGAWFQWAGAIVGAARLLGELSDLGPLVEHPDPRKATT